MPPLNTDPTPTVPLDLEAIRQKLVGARGHLYWRSLEELAETESFQELLHREFPSRASEWTNPLTRRRFLMLMGASLALAGITGCGSRPAEKIVPYVKEPPGMVPGKPLFFATAMPLAGMLSGVLVESNMGRPTKVEGNPEHPASKGATDSFAQASILGLYDPDRAQTITSLGKVRTWDDTLSELRAELAKLKGNKSGGLRILTGRISSPTLTDQLLELFKQFPDAKWHSYEPAVSDTPLEGALLAFDQQVQPCYQLENAELKKAELKKADVILSLDADFLSSGPGHLRYVREFSARRTGEPAEMNRLYVAESMFTTTGACADHHLPLKASAVEGLARAIAAEVGVPGIKPAAGDLKFLGDEKKGKHWVKAVANDLKFSDGDKTAPRDPGSTLVIAGEGQPPVVHALAHAMNAVLGNINKTVAYIRPIPYWTSPRLSTLPELTTAMERGEVQVLLILGGNPVYNAPVDLEFAQKMKKQVRLRIHLAPYFNETSALCQWHLPEAHYLETWSDGRAYDGTATIMQPLIAPLYNGKSAHELVSGLIDPAPLTGYELVRGYWQKQWQERKADAFPAGVPSGPFETFWKSALHSGVVAGTAFQPIRVTLDLPNFAKKLPAASAAGKDYEIVFRPDPTLFDGQFANNGWLQELPKPLTRLCWDNAAIMSPKTAKDLGITLRIGSRGGEHGETWADMVTLQFAGRQLTLPAWILPGHADDSITVHLGYGRQRAGKVGTGTGFDAYQLRGSDRPWFGSGVTVTKTGKQYLLACTQAHHSMEGRDLLRSGTVAEYEADPKFAQRADEHHKKEKNHKESGDESKNHKESGESKRRPLSLYEPYEYKGHKWGMVINLSACVGCGACVVACQAENNIPVVGKEEVNRGREMHWLRVDRYFTGDPFTAAEEVKALHQPVPCMQCENAPCEQVCPVAATAHSFDGLNDMVYNRCVGTRYCSNNCPYKVRRFNFLQYADFDTPSLKLMYNPEVTVRSRGVMEKCTYCVQRIRAGEIEAQKEHRPLVNGQNVSLIRDGEVMTACQAVCPAQAIIFGDLTGPDKTGKDHTTHSEVAKLRSQPLNYSMLAELNTNPRTTYLAALRNPNPKLLAEANGD